MLPWVRYFIALILIEKLSFYSHFIRDGINMYLDIAYTHIRRFQKYNFVVLHILLCSLICKFICYIFKISFFIVFFPSWIHSIARLDRIYSLRIVLKSCWEAKLSLVARWWVGQLWWKESNFLGFSPVAQLKRTKDDSYSIPI